MSHSTKEPHPPAGRAPATTAGTVALQGEAGAFSHEAAIQLFGKEVAIVPCRSFHELFEAVVEGRAVHGVVPVENTLAGMVAGNLDLILRHSIHVVRETYVRVELCLMVRPGATLREIRSAASHPVALEQCHRFFRKHPEIRPVAVYDTAGAVRDLVRSEPGYDAAIGSALAGELYGAQVLQRGLEDDARNYTRFLAISREPAPAPASESRTKTALAFTVEHRPGALHHALGVIAGHGVDITTLNSRPIPGRPWEYRFYADLRSDDLATVECCLQELTEACRDVWIFGRFPEAPPPL